MKKLFAAVLTLALFVAIALASNGTATTNAHFVMDGLMAVCTGDPNTYSVGVLNVAHHTPELTIKSGNETVLQLRGADQIGHLNIALSTKEHRLSKFHPGLNNENDFAWVLDMESDLFQKRLNVRKEALGCQIDFKDGLFMGDNLSKDLLTFHMGEEQHPFKRRVAQPAVNIQIAPDQQLIISRADGTVVKSLPYIASGYQVTIHNLPPKEMANVDHFMFYYSAVSEPVTNWEPLVIKRASFFPRPLACQSVVFSRSSIN